MKKTKRKLSEVPCQADGCNRVPTDRCHIKSAGAGGTFDHENILMMCREHHSEQHKSGWSKFLAARPLLKKFMAKKGWVIENIFGVDKLVSK